jgi:hypothetical protein
MVIYVAGPYTADSHDGVVHNLKKAELVAEELLLHGATPLISHKVTSHFERRPRLKHFTGQDWLDKQAIPLLRICDAMILTEGWEKSPGCQKEIEFARQHRIPVFYSLEDAFAFINEVPCA